MFAYDYHECPHCGVEIEIEIEINETDGDLPDDCPFCGKKLDDAGDPTADAIGGLTDAATDHAKEDNE